MTTDKKSTALKTPINWFPFLVVAVPCLWALSFWIQDWPLAVIAAVMTVYLLLDAKNLVQKKKAAQKESESAKKDGLGT